jgi:A/G-specific adenine glycosylase
MPKQSFSTRLLKWHAKNPRPHPWKSTKDPYKTWISEIILQQTKVEAGTPYYLRFVKTFPNVEALAAASLDDVYALWSGLGYYSRAKNLHESAKRIVTEFNGKFPSTYKDILSLKGIGPYTAAAISSFAFDLPTAVMDGNVKRVIARHHGFEEDVMTSASSKALMKILEEDYFNWKKPSQFNQAIMDFGALLCKPKQPNCGSCPVAKDCYALEHNKASYLPVRKASIKRKDRYFHYIVLRTETQALFKKREEKDIWQNLFDFPLIETNEKEDLSKSDVASFINTLTNSPFNQEDIRFTGPKSQLLSHQRIIARFYSLYLNNLDKINTEGLYLFDIKNSSSFAVPKIIDLYLKDKSIYLFS